MILWILHISSRMRGGGSKTKKSKKSPQSRTVMGQLLPPVDIRESKQLNELKKRISSGPLTLVLVYADWCGHCTRFKPMMEQLENCAGRSIQTARIRDDMFPKSALSSEKIDGYPTLMLVKKDGKVQKFKTESGELTNAVPDHTNLNKMKLIVRNAGKSEAQGLLGQAAAGAVGALAANALGNNATQENSEVVEVNLNSDPSAVENVNQAFLAEEVSVNGVNAMNGSSANGGAPNIIADRYSQNIVNQQNRILNANTQRGGSLWANLAMASQKLAPAASLFLASELMRSKKQRKTRKIRKSRKARK
jgi:thiol-disulfide isomerase/thioredoxin